MQTQTVSLGSFKKFSEEKDGSEQSPSLSYSRVMSRFQFAHSVDPIKKDGGFKFGFGCATSEVDKEEILVPRAVQELIHNSIRTLSNSISNRSPEDAVASNMRDTSNPLGAVEEIEAELEQKWYTLEEQTQDHMMHTNPRSTFEETKGEVTNTNPFRMLHKKEKDAHQAVSSNLDVKRVKYSFKQTSPGDERGSPVEETKGAA